MSKIILIESCDFDGYEIFGSLIPISEYPFAECGL